METIEIKPVSTEAQEKLVNTNVKVVGVMDLSKFEKKKVEKVIETKQEIPGVQKTEVIVLPKVIIHFFKDKQKKIIGRMENGKIAIIDFSYKGEWVQDNEDWEVQIKDDTFPKKTIVVPVKRVKTNEENLAVLQSSLNELSNKDWNKASGNFHPLQKKKYTQHKNI